VSQVFNLCNYTDATRSGEVIGSRPYNNIDRDKAELEKSLGYIPREISIYGQ